MDDLRLPISGPRLAAEAGDGGAVTLGAGALGRLMPMYLHLDQTGRIRGHGPTLAKIAAGTPLLGQDFFALFEVRRPVGVQAMADLAAQQGARLHLALRCAADPVQGVEFRGLALGDTGSGLVINLSFGIGVVDAVGRHGLTDADFSATDLAVELLYLVEAKRAVMGELQRLNRRLQGAKSEAEEQALTDTLTGLRNRRALDHGLAQAVAGTAPFAVMHLDLDRFKAVNDTLGHAAGDQVLRCVAQLLSAETRAGDLVARVGGDEFVILLPGLVDRAALTAVAERIVAALAVPIPFEDHLCRIGVSVGLTVSTFYDQPDAERMLLDADTALYAAKRAGRGRVAVFSTSL